ncbi:WBSCR27 [Branchiostoma lanceolatum]|uniref:WBSCR27 protein n=1 Tax=Branchiostoma lanceolatum TaxID=7740 RepID=A0A8J9YRU8_BRALA|nr:WBSCR27 [Branchiostoma lanceolatum]
MEVLQVGLDWVPHLTVLHIFRCNEPLLATVKRRKLQWFGHVTRHDNLAKTILQGTLEGGRRRGRQKKSWQDNIAEWTSLSLSERLAAARNRRAWRQISIFTATLSPQRPGGEGTRFKLSNMSVPRLLSEETAKCYDNWSGNYEKELMTQLKCTAPRECADAMEKTMGGSNRKEVRVLDVAAGTGLCAEELVKKGFTNIDAVDGSQGMLDLAEKKQIYRRLICDFVGPKPLDIENNTYDAIACCSGFAAGHLKEDCLPELIRVVKPGGYIVITFREEWLHHYEDYKDKLEPAMARLQDKGLWERVSREVFPNFYPGKNGITIVYKVL